MTCAQRSRFLLAITCGALAGCSSSTIRIAQDGGVDDSGQDGAVRACEAANSVISGVAYAPNGEDPLPGARVYIVDEAPDPFQETVSCETCEDRYAAQEGRTVESQANGAFTLSQVCPGEQFLVIENGRFRRVVPLTVAAEESVALTAEQTRLPKRNGETHPADAVPRVAVATGDYDKMECVLRHIGLDDDAIELFEGAKFLRVRGNNLPSFRDLYRDLDRLMKYQIVFINCTQDTFEEDLKDSTVRRNIAQYLNSGGRLYVTDWSYDWIEQLPELSPHMDFEPGPSDDAPETANAAALGVGEWVVEGVIEDTRMAQWLALFPNTITNGRVHLDHFLGGWVMAHEAKNETKTWVSGEVQSEDGSIQGTRPLTMSFNYQNCGKALFTSYHTLGRDDEIFPSPPRPKSFPNYCAAEVAPQERILAYLIFEMTSCLQPSNIL